MQIREISRMAFHKAIYRLGLTPQAFKPHLMESAVRAIEEAFEQITPSESFPSANVFNDLQDDPENDFGNILGGTE